VDKEAVRKLGRRAEIVARFAEARVRHVIKHNQEIQSLLNHFPCLVGRRVALQPPGNGEEAEF